MASFYFYDCPRTGGTSVKLWCRDNKVLNRLHYGDDKGGWHHVPFKPKSEIDELKPVGVDKIWTLTFLRDPVEHTASLYAKIRNHKHSYRDRIRSLTFTKWIHGVFGEDVGCAPAPWGFSMVRFYDPKSDNLETAIKNVESIDYVGFTDRLVDDMNGFLSMVGEGVKFDGRKLNVASRNFGISESDRRIIREVRAADFELVNHFRRKLGLSTF